MAECLAGAVGALKPEVIDISYFLPIFVSWYLLSVVVAGNLAFFPNFNALGYVASLA